MTFLEGRSANAETEKKVLFSADTDDLATITKVSALENAHYNRRATSIGKDGSPSYDSGKYQFDLVINHTAEPNFKDPTVLKKAGVATPEELVNKFLTAGEVAELANEIQEFSGLSKTLKELKKEAKNS